MGAKNLALGALAGVGVAGLTVATGGAAAPAILGGGAFVNAAGATVGGAAAASAASSAAPALLAGLTAAAGTASSLAQADQAQAAADYNAKAAAIEGDQAQQEANAAAQRKQAEIRRILAAQRAAIGASGMLASGSFADLQADTAAEGMRDARAFLYGGQMAKARGRQQSQLDRQQGRAAGQAGQIGVASSLLSAGYQGYSLTSRR